MNPTDERLLNHFNALAANLQEERTVRLMLNIKLTLHNMSPEARVLAAAAYELEYGQPLTLETETNV